MQSNNFLATPTTMKISTTVNRPQKVETEIELPYYFKTRNWYFKVFSEDFTKNNAIQTTGEDAGDHQLARLTRVSPEQIIEGNLSSEEEFNKSIKYYITRIAEASGEVVSIMFYNEMPKP